MGNSKNIHVPRVWEITGRAPEDRRRAVREWNNAYLGKIAKDPSFGKPSQKKLPYRPQRASLNTTVLHEQRHPKRWHDYRPPT